MSSRPRVYIVVLNYMYAQDTLRCVESLQRLDYPSVNILVVDNGSSPDVADVLAGNLDPVVQFQANESNLGYAGGNNVGIERALDQGADFVWLVNPDVVADEDALEFLVRTAIQYPQAGIVGSRILYGGVQPAKIWFDGGVIDWNAAGATTHMRMGALESDNPAQAAFDVDYVTGAGMLLRRQLIDHIGLLPENWFLYFEETDFNLTAREHGWRTMVNPKSRLHHFKRSTGPLPEPYYVYYFIRNRMRFGIERAGAEEREIRADLTTFVEAWRQKVEARAPDWTSSYDRLVGAAIADGIDGVTGYRDLSKFSRGSS